MGTIEVNKVYEGNCLDILSEVADGSVDLILTDPPYNVSRKSNFHTMGRKGVDFGEWDKGFDQQEWISEAGSKVRDGGSIVVFNDYKNIGDISEALESGGFTVKELIIWRKTNPMPRNRDRLYVTSVEVALWAVKKRGWAFNRERSNYENAIFEYPIVHHSKRYHPTQKPLKLMEDLLRIHSNPGDVVLDPFIGSGSTAVAAVNTGRNFIGIEMDPEYVAISNDRIKEALSREDDR